jgi:hypothetical protein
MAILPRKTPTAAGKAVTDGNSLKRTPHCIGSAGCCDWMSYSRRWRLFHPHSLSGEPDEVVTPARSGPWPLGPSRLGCGGEPQFSLNPDRPTICNLCETSSNGMTVAARDPSAGSGSRCCAAAKCEGSACNKSDCVKPGSDVGKSPSGLRVCIGAGPVAVPCALIITPCQLTALPVRPCNMQSHDDLSMANLMHVH